MPPGYFQKPGRVTTIAVITLINGIINILYALGLTIGVVFVTLFIGILCAPLTLSPGVLGIFEIITLLSCSQTPQGQFNLQQLSLSWKFAAS